MVGGRVLRDFFVVVCVSASASACVAAMVLWAGEREVSSWQVALWGWGDREGRGSSVLKRRRHGEEWGA